MWVHGLFSQLPEAGDIDSHCCVMYITTLSGLHQQTHFGSRNNNRSWAYCKVSSKKQQSEVEGTLGTTNNYQGSINKDCSRGN